MFSSKRRCAMRQFIVILAMGLLPAFAFASGAETRQCDRQQKKRIRAALTTLKTTLADLDQRLGRNGLSPWLGKSRDRFAKRLTGRTLKMRCHLDCEAPKFQVVKLGDWALPIAHGSGLELCLSDEMTPEKLVVAVAHGLAHLSRINAHRLTCEERCLKPRFSHSIMLAIYHAQRGSFFDSAQCLSRCQPTATQDSELLSTPTDAARPELPNDAVESDSKAAPE